MMISCEDAQQICTKNQYKEAPWRERFKLIFHLMICKTCGAFSRKNTQLTKLCEKASLYALSEPEKEKMKKAIEAQKE